MIKEITIYEANGVRFDDLETASKYEVLCDDIERIMSRLNPRPKGIENGVCFVEQDVEILKSCFSDFCISCAKFFSDNEKDFIELANDNRLIYRIVNTISQSPSEFIRYNFYRFECMDFIRGYEFQTPYLAKLEAMEINKTHQTHEEHIKANESCCEQFEKGIKRIWEKV